MHPELTTVCAFHDGLVRLAARASEFDAIYPGHFETPQPVQLLHDMVELAGRILQDPSVYDDMQDMFGQKNYAKRRHYGRAYIAFKDEFVG